MTMSASFSASALTMAPAAANSESGRPDLTPAPGSIAMSTPNALNFFTVSGEAATRGSEGSISLATAIFMGPPAARSAREQTSVISAKCDTGFATGIRGIQAIAPPRCGAISNRSGQKDRHHGDDEDHGTGAVFHQHDETFIGLLMGRIIVAVSGRVGHFVMLCHRSPPSMFGSAVELPQTTREGNGGAAFVHLPQLRVT